MFRRQFISICEVTLGHAIEDNENPTYSEVPFKN